MKKIEIIAEIGQNHNGDLALAIELIKQAKQAGADVAKFQLYDAKALFPKENNPWYEYNCKTELSFEQAQSLKEVCDEQQIEFMASAFDCERVAWLEELGVKRYKVASRSIYDTPLVDRLIDTGKPLIVSCGLWKESKLPVIPNASLLYCVCKYPTPLHEFDIENIDFSQYRGVSDHTEGLSASFASMAKGAMIVERHFTLDKSLEGPDHTCSLNQEELKALCQFRDDLDIMRRKIPQTTSSSVFELE